MFSITLDTTSVDRDTLTAELWEAGTTGITEAEDWIRAFFDDNADTAELLDRFRDHDPRLESVEARDWVAESRDQWQPFPVGDRFFLVPEWRDDPAPCGRIRLRTHPGMACGTGAHPATQLCLRALEQHVTDGMSLLDVGTGSGILAEAARLLGADPVIACDIDPEAAAIAKRNLAQSIFNVPVFSGSVRSVRTRALNAIVANLNLAVLQSIHSDILRILDDEGLLIVSGFREDQSQTVAELFKRPVPASYESQDWSCLVIAPLSGHLPA